MGTGTTSTRQKVGLVIAGLFCVAAIPSIFASTPDGQVGPPVEVSAVDSLLGVVGTIAVVIAWRTGSRAALRVAAGAMIATTLTALPGLFVDVPVLLKLLIAVSVLITIAAVVLMFSSSRPAVPSSTGEATFTSGDRP